MLIATSKYSNWHFSVEESPHDVADNATCQGQKKDSLEVIEVCEVLDVFTPPREDYLIIEARHMRRKECEITDPQKIELILNSATIGRMATNGADGYPYITPVNFVYFQGNIYFHCALQGEKLDNLSRNPKVCFEVDIPLAYLDAGVDPGRHVVNLHQYYHCVVIKGEARIIPSGPLKVAALNALVVSHEQGVNNELVHEEMAAYKACNVVESCPTVLTAKSNLHQGKSSEARLANARYLKNRNRPGDLATARAMGFDPENM